MSEFDVAVAAMGAIEEYGSARVTLPESYYPVQVSVTGQGTGADVVDDEGELVKPGTPWIQLSAMVTEGPYEGAETESRVFLTPGKGANIGFVNNMAKAISGRPVSAAALDKYKFVFSDPKDREAVQNDFIARWWELTSDERVDFMAQYCNIGTWDGKALIIKIGVEDNNWKSDDGVEHTSYRNRFQGFYPVNDPKKGLK